MQTLIFTFLEDDEQLIDIEVIKAAYDDLLESIIAGEDHTEELEKAKEEESPTPQKYKYTIEDYRQERHLLKIVFRSKTEINAILGETFEVP